MGETFVFPDCGCEWPVVGPPPYLGGPPAIKVDFRKIPFCSAAVALLATGRTKGVFQLEKRLGQKWAKEVAPQTREHVAALASILRPGVLKSKDENGVSITQLYALRKNGRAAAAAANAAEEECLGTTYFLMLFQEQLRALAKRVANFDDLEAELLQKTAAKKDPQGMAAFGTKFVTQAVAGGVVDQAGAERLWANILNSGRYLFNKSHAWSYGGLTIVTAYLKAHNPPAFFSAWLQFAGEAQDPDQEKAELVADARLFGVEVRCPDLRLRKARTSLPCGAVAFGLADVSGVGEAAAAKLLAAVASVEGALGRPLERWSWYDYLYHASKAVSSKVNEQLIAAGALDGFKADRLRMAEEYRVWRALSDGERKWVLANAADRGLQQALRDGLAAPRKRGGFALQPARVETVEGLLYCLDHPAHSLFDTPGSMEDGEKKTLGVAVTTSVVDGLDTSAATHTLPALASAARRLRPGDEVRVAGQVVEAKPITTKRGDPMVWLTITDGKTNLGDIAVFSDRLDDCRPLLRTRNTLLVTMTVSARGGFAVSGVRQL